MSIKPKNLSLKAVSCSLDSKTSSQAAHEPVALGGIDQWPGPKRRPSWPPEVAVHVGEPDAVPGALPDLRHLQRREALVEDEHRVVEAVVEPLPPVPARERSPARV